MITAASGIRPKTTPAEVATPLPPLKPKPDRKRVPNDAHDRREDRKVDGMRTRESEVLRQEKREPDGGETL